VPSTPSNPFVVSAAKGFVQGFVGTLLVGAAIATKTLAGAAVAVGAVGYGAYQTTIDVQKAITGTNPYTGQALSPSELSSVRGGVIGGLIGGAAGLGVLKLAGVPLGAGGAQDRVFYHYTSEAGYQGINKTGKILASESETYWSVNASGVHDAGVFNPATGMGNRSSSPNVFFTDVPPSAMTPELAGAMGIKSTSRVISVTESAIVNQGLPFLRNPSHPNVYSAVGEAVYIQKP
jgi:hypothetical protein